MGRLKTLLGNGFKLGARGLLAAALAVTALGLAAPPASAATIVVNTTTDQSLGSCSSSCSLRDAAATAASGDTIKIPAGHYVLTLGEMFIFNKSLTIAGDGARSTVIDGNSAARIFEFSNPAGLQSVEFDDVSLINGFANVPVLEEFFGGALAGDTPTNLTLRRCRLAGNQALGGGAIVWVGGLLTIDQCTIEGNHAIGFVGDGPGEGGGIVALGALTITNSTLTGNTALKQGGGVEMFGSLNLVNVTATANEAPTAGGILLSPDAAPIVANTIIADNPGGDCFGVTAVGGHNLDSDNSCGFTGPGDLPGTNPLLGPLANNGGPTDTQALLAGSPALDAGNNSTCLATDQRGVTRPQGPACDIGAFEAVVSPQDQIAALIAQVKALVTAGKLAQSNANPLLNTLDNAAKHLDKGQVKQTCKELGDFIQKVNGDIQTGKLTVADGQALINAANAIRANLGC